MQFKKIFLLTIPIIVMTIISFLLSYNSGLFLKEYYHDYCGEDIKLTECLISTFLKDPFLSSYFKIFLTITVGMTFFFPVWIYVSWKLLKMKKIAAKLFIVPVVMFFINYTVNIMEVYVVFHPIDLIPIASLFLIGTFVITSWNEFQ